MERLSKLTGTEQFLASGRPVGRGVLDFWCWAYSDLNANVIRGAFAEFVVATALGIPLQEPRVPWAEVDLESPGMPKIEVKAAAYVQSWPQEKPSDISFRYPATSAVAGSSKKVRPSDVYVFCLLTPRQREDVDMLNFDLWRFFVVPTAILNKRQRSQTDITLASLEQLVEGVAFNGLLDEFRRLRLVA